MNVCTYHQLHFLQNCHHKKQNESTGNTYIEGASLGDPTQFERNYHTTANRTEHSRIIWHMCRELKLLQITQIENFPHRRPFHTPRSENEARLVEIHVVADWKCWSGAIKTVIILWTNFE